VPPPGGKKESSKDDDGQELKSQKTVDLAAFVQKPNSKESLFSGLSIAKKPAEPKGPEN